MTHADVVARLTERLAEPLPGFAAHVTMAPFAAPPDASVLSVEGKPEARRAATLVLVYPGAEGEARFVLTVRQAGLRDHSGQISLPGGRLDAGETPEDAARREAWEEVGVPPDAPRVLGRLSPIYIPPSGFAVWPVCASVDRAPSFRPHDAEVAALLDVAVADLLDPATRRTRRMTLRGTAFDVPVFALGGHDVWGATAMMLAEFVALAGRTDGREPPA